MRENEHKKRAVLYARVSDDDRRYATSGIEGQLKECQEYAEARRYEIVGQYFEDPNSHTSGAEWLPEIEKILGLAEQQAFDVLVVRELDRLARNRLKHLLIKHHLAELGIKIDYVIGQFADTDEGEFQEGVMREFAHYQRKQLARKLHKGIRDSVKRGNIKTGGCGVPYGYDLMDVDGRSTMVINEAEAEVVRCIFDRYVSESYSLYAICQYLDDHDILKPLKGKAHRANADDERNLGWSRGTLSGIISNETYVGRWYYRKTRTVKDPKTKKIRHVPRPKREWILVDVPAIIPDPLFQAAQERREKNKKRRGKQHSHTYAIGGMVSCGHCGQSMSGITSQRKNGDRTYTYSYYVCNARRNSKQYGYECDNPYVRVEAAEDTIWQCVRGLLLESQRLADAHQSFRDDEQARLQPFLNLIESNGKRCGKLQTKKERLMRAYRVGALSLEEIARQKTELDRQISATEHAMEELQADLEPQMLRNEELETIGHYAAHFWGDADLTDKNSELQREIYDLLDLEVTFQEVEDTQLADLRCVLGQIRLSLSDGLDHRLTQALCDFPLQEEALPQMKAEEEKKRERILAKCRDILLKTAERGRHTVYDESLSWAENKYIIRKRWESGGLPEKLSRTERKLFGEVIDEINAKREGEEMRSKERAMRIKKHLLTHRFFWERIKTIWPYLTATERLHILHQLQDVEWNQRIVAEIRQVIENAQFFDAAAQKAGAAQGRDKLSSEEIDLLLDLSDEEVWNELLDLYRQKPNAGQED